MFLGSNNHEQGLSHGGRDHRPSAGADLRLVERRREKLRRQLRSGKLNHRMVEIEVRDHPAGPFSFQVFEGASMEEFQLNMRDFLASLAEAKPKRRRMEVEEAGCLAAAILAGAATSVFPSCA